MKKLILALPLTVLLSACGTPTTKTNSTAVGGLNTASRTPELYISTRHLKEAQPEECPMSSKTWRKEQTRAIIQYAARCTQLSKWQRVEEFGSHLAQTEPTLPWGPYFLSLAAEGRREYIRALWMVELALKKSPKSGMFLYQKGRVYWAMTEFDQAMQNFELAVKMDPNLTDAHLILAQVYYRDSNFKSAEKNFTRVLTLEPQNSLALVGMAEVMLRSNKTDQAVEYFEKAVNESPRDISIRIRLAGVYETVVKDTSKALATYRKAHSLSRDSRSLAQELGVDLESKIKTLESQLAQAAPGEKVSNRVTKKGRVK